MREGWVNGWLVWFGGEESGGILWLVCVYLCRFEVMELGYCLLAFLLACLLMIGTLVHKISALVLLCFFVDR